MRFIKLQLFIQKRVLSRACTSLLYLGKRYNITSPPVEVTIATKQHNEKAGGISLSKTSLILVNKYCTSLVKFEQVCDETLDSLSEYFEELIEGAQHLQAADVSYGVSNELLIVYFSVRVTILAKLLRPLVVIYYYYYFLTLVLKKPETILLYSHKPIKLR